MRILSETIVKHMFELDGITPLKSQDNTPLNRINALKKEDLLPADISDILYKLRTKGNRAVHEGYDCHDDAKVLLEMSYNLSGWFMQTYGDYTYEPDSFILPEDTSRKLSFEQLLEEDEKLTARIEEETAITLSPLVDTSVQASERRKRAYKAAHNLKLSEKETRVLIDEQLKKVGWEADSINLRYSKGIRPEKGRNLAIAEWPTDSNVCRWGHVDYALFVGLKLVGVIEAKSINTDVSSLIDNQCRDYSMGIRDEHAKYVINSWGAYKAPFLFATNGRRHSKQLETKSGIWFRDARCDSNMPRALLGWHRPTRFIRYA
jgi:type I restriction enzyme R subunit